MNLVLRLCLVSACASAFAATESHRASERVQRPAWLLDGFLKLSETQPRRLLRIADGLFESSRMKLASSSPNYAYEWQHRLAMVSALSQIFDPSGHYARLLGDDAERIREHARHLLLTALEEDPSLLVRDGAVESVRRVLRMRAKERGFWKPHLERAFMDSKNHIEGEGLFIRETILMAFREGSLKPSKRIWRAAEHDQNPDVRNILREWNTAAYDDL